MPRAGSHATGRQFELTERQRDVIVLMARGKTNFEIAQALGLSLEGAKYHVSEILAKLDVTSREEAVAAWREHRTPARLRQALAAVTLSRLGVGLAGFAAVAGAVAIAAAIAATRDDGGSATDPSGFATATPSPFPTATGTAQPSPTPSPVPSVQPSPSTPAKGPDVRWRWDSGELQSTVWLSASRGALIASVAANSVDQFVPQPGYVAAIDDATGVQRWRFATPSQPYPAFVTETAVVFGTADGTVFGVDPATGAERWRVAFPGVPYTVTGAGTVVVVADTDPPVWNPIDWGRGLFADSSRLRGRAWGIDPATGAVVWQKEFGTSSVFATSAFVVLAAADGAVVRLDPNTGDVLWRRTLTAVNSPPVLFDDLVVVPGSQLTALDIDTGETLWSAAPPDSQFPYSFPANSKANILASAGERLDAFTGDGALAWGARGPRCPTSSGTANVLLPARTGKLLGWFCGGGLWLVSPASSASQIEPWLIPQGAVQSVVVTAGGVAISTGIGSAPVQVLGLAGP